MSDVGEILVRGIPTPLPPQKPSPLVALNTHAVGYFGVGTGVAIIAALVAFFNWLKSPTNLIDLWGELERHQFGTASATVLGLFIGIIGAIVVAIAAAWLSRPPTIASSPAK